jgi:RHS repeat-associated protein
VLSLREPARRPLPRLAARVLILALAAGLLPPGARASAADSISLTKSAFGELLAHTGSDPQPYAFTGEPLDPNSGFQYHRARWLDPSGGRFVGMDPFAGLTNDPLSLHKYTYARVSPVSWCDPTGLVSPGVLGTLIHQDIERMYPNQSGLLDPPMIPGFPERLFPDLADGDTKEVIEIKPLSRRWGMTGWHQVEGYVRALNYVGSFLKDIGTGWHEGYWSPEIRGYTEPTTGMPYMVFGNAGGVIFYWYPERKISKRVWDKLQERATAIARNPHLRAEEEIARLGSEADALLIQDYAILGAAAAVAAYTATMAAISAQMSTRLTTPF